MPVLRSVLALAFLVIFVPLGALITFPWTLISGNVAAMYAVGQWLGYTAVRIAGVRIHVTGRERLKPDQTYIFMSNHASNLDPPILIQALGRRTSVLVKKVLFRIPLLGRAMRMASYVPVDRTRREDAVASLHQAAKVLQSGMSMSIFVEGTRSPDGRLLPFKKGPFYIAMEAGLPIIPVTLVGTHDRLPKGKFGVNSGAVTVVFHETIDPSAHRDRDELMNAVRESIASALPPELR
jgi:1-acyl-sn-glycerol-3-phosphate acyltransferase